MVAATSKELMGDFEAYATVCCTALVLRDGSSAPPIVRTASNEDDLLRDVCHVDVLLRGGQVVVKGRQTALV